MLFYMIVYSVVGMLSLYYLVLLHFMTCYSEQYIIVIVVICLPCSPT